MHGVIPSGKSWPFRNHCALPFVVVQSDPPVWSITGTIIDKNVQIGADCRITNAAGVQEADGDDWYIRDGVIVLPKNAILPDGTVI